MFWGGCENQEFLTAPKTSIGDRRRFGCLQLTALWETLHLHASHSVPPFSPREGGGTRRACPSTFPASLLHLFPQRAGLWAAGRPDITALCPQHSQSSLPHLQSWNCGFILCAVKVKSSSTAPPRLVCPRMKAYMRCARSGGLGAVAHGGYYSGGGGAKARSCRTVQLISWKPV